MTEANQHDPFMLVIKKKVRNTKKYITLGGSLGLYLRLI